MYKAIILSVFLCTGLMLYAQTGNPFELKVHPKYRMGKTREQARIMPVKNPDLAKPDKKKDVSPKFGSSNPFEKGAHPENTSGVNRMTQTHAVAISHKEHSGRTSARKSVQKVFKSENDYLFWILTFLLLVLSIIINLNRSMLGILYRSVTNDNYLNNFALTANSQMRILLNLYYFYYLINAGIFLYLVLQARYEWTGIPRLLQSIGAVFIVYGFYHTALMLMRWVYPIKKETTLYLFTIKTFESTLGLFLLILNFAIAFTPAEIAGVLIKTGIGLFIIFYLLRMVRGFFLSNRYMVTHTFHFILYLCSFEIAPFLIIYQWVHGLG